MVICQQCKQKTLEKKDAVRIDNKNFHKKCAKIYQDKKELTETICRIFNLKAPGPKNNAYISKFHNEGMTYNGMTGTLIYFYEIKKMAKDKANNGIGIIPYVYEEARDYYKKIEEGAKMAEQSLEKNKEEREKNKGKTNKVKMPEPTPVTFKREIYSQEDIEW